MSEVTRILSAIEQGDPHAAAQLLPLVYDELRRLAAEWSAPVEVPGWWDRRPAGLASSNRRDAGPTRQINRGGPLAHGPDGKCVASVSEDQTVKVMVTAWLPARQAAR
jgi:hypothetical protein